MVALKLLVLPRMVLTQTVLIFPDPLKDAKVLVPLDEAVQLLRWCQSLLAATLVVLWRVTRGTPLVEDAPLEPDVGWC